MSENVLVYDERRAGSAWFSTALIDYTQQKLLSPSEAWIYCVLCAFPRSHSSDVNIIQQIANRSNSSERAVESTLDHLAQLGFISRSSVVDSQLGDVSFLWDLNPIPPISLSKASST